MKDLPRHLTGLVAILIACFIIGMLFYRAIPSENRDIAMVILGSAITWAGNVFSFHFGSSQGSKDKADHINRIGDGP